MSSNSNFKPHRAFGRSSRSNVGSSPNGGNAHKLKDNTLGSVKVVFSLEKLFFAFSTVTSTISCFTFAWGITYNPQVFTEMSASYYLLGAFLMVLSMLICATADFLLVGIVLRDASYLAIAGIIYRGLTISQYIKLVMLFIFGSAGVAFTTFTSFEGSEYSNKKVSTFYEPVAQYEPMNDLQKKYNGALSEQLAPLNAEVAKLREEKNKEALAFLGKDMYKLVFEKKNNWAVKQADSMGLKKHLAHYETREQDIRKEMDVIRQKNKSSLEKDEQVVLAKLGKKNDLSTQNSEMAGSFIFWFGFVPCVLGVIIAIAKGAYKADRQFRQDTGDLDPNEEDLVPN